MTPATIAVFQRNKAFCLTSVDELENLLVASSSPGVSQAAPDPLPAGELTLYEHTPFLLDPQLAVSLYSCAAVLIPAASFQWGAHDPAHLHGRSFHIPVHRQPGSGALFSLGNIAPDWQGARRKRGLTVASTLPRVPSFTTPQAGRGQQPATSLTHAGFTPRRCYVMAKSLL